MFAAPTNPQQVPTVAVIGTGIAGLSAAVAAAEDFARNGPGRVVLIDRAPAAEAGGNTRWTSAYFRLDDVYDPGANFIDDVVGFSDGQTPRRYVERLVEELPAAMEWIQGHGVRFRRLSTYFINSSRDRLQPVGGGEGLLRALLPVALQRGVEVRYDTTAIGLDRDGGRLRAVRVQGEAGEHLVPADAVIIASGGFEGNVARMNEEFGADSSTLRPIAPSVAFNRGEGIDMALAAGAMRAGQWSSFHAEPVDPRSPDAEALVMVFPYGILVNKRAQRFVDEGAGTVDETYESVSRAVWRQPGNAAFFITDARFGEVEARERGILTGVKPVTAQTLIDLAAQLGLPAEELTETVATFNAAAPSGSFDWRTPDGLATHGLEPPKTNWALPVDQPPFLAYPVACAVVFTLGGIATDDHARVVDNAGEPIKGLYAAGECTGIYYGKYPGGTSVMRGLVYGRIAGAAAAACARQQLLEHSGESA